MAMLQRIMKEDPAHLHWLWQRHFKGTGLLKFHDIKDKRYRGQDRQNHGFTVDMQD